MKYWKILILVALTYVILYVICMVVLTEYEAWYDSKMGDFYSFSSFNANQKIAFVLYKYLLNFPLSIFNWFTNKFLSLTTIFLLPNVFVFSYLIYRLLNR